MAVEGKISVELDVEAEHVHAVRVSSSRPVDATRALLGLPVEAMLESVPLLFSVCSEAQSVAAREACEAALGIEAGEGRRVARQLRVTCEAIDNQALQVVLGWPALFGQEPVVEPLRALREATGKLRALGAPFATWGATSLRKHPGLLSVPSDPPSELDVRVAAGLVRVRLFELLRAPLPAKPGELERWARGPGVAQETIAALLGEGLQGSGRSEVQLLPELPASWFEAQVEADGAFEWAPRYQGLPAETGALARLRESPLISGLLEEHGNGLLTRFVARLADLEALGLRASSLAEALRSPEATSPPRRSSGQGAAVVETSRGRLAHVVTIEEGRLLGWRVVAPTEWNFHPEGPLAAGLEGVPVEDARRLATFLVNGLDPCVGFEVVVRRAAHA